MRDRRPDSAVVVPAPRNGERGYFPDSSQEWNELDRLREIIGEVEARTAAHPC
jgi:hypothetical protein